MAANPLANSAAARKLGLDVDQPANGANHFEKEEKEQKGWRGRRKRSEWVFRPLRVKFKVKELEELYQNSVFRQKQSLLLSACGLMAFISFLFVLTYLGKEKVYRERTPAVATTPIPSLWSEILKAKPQS